jgi:tetratricopeptide (TPR) repeat protein
MRRPLLAYLVLLLSLVVTYGRTLDAPLIWDDRHLVLDTLEVANNEHFLQRFREPFWIEDGSGDARAYYRPLTVLSFALDHSLHGENPAGYHLTNAALHTLNALLLLTLLLRRRADLRVALLLSAAWALHPRLTEAAGWVSGRTDVLATTFCFLALLVHRSRSFGHSLASAGLLFFGLASKEVALAGVAALIAKELCWRAPGPREPDAWKRGLVFALPLLGALLAYGGLRLNALAGTKPLLVPLSLGERLAAVVEAWGRYAFDLAVPWLPRAQQGKLGQPDYRFIALALVATLLAAGAIAWRRRASSRRSAPVATEVDLPNRVELATLGAVSLGLVVHLVPISIAVVTADRFLYLPLAAVALGLAPPLTRAVQHRPLLLAPLFAFALTLGAATWLRLDEWRNELAFWRATYETTPKTNSLPGNELGNVYYRAGLFEHALRVYRVTAETVADDPFVLGNTASALSQLGRYDDALALFERLCAERTDVASHCLKAALVELSELHFDRARQLLAEAEKRAPNREATNPVKSAIEKLEAGARDSALTSSNATSTAEARFRLSLLAGRRLDTLHAAERLLQEPRAPGKLRREAAEYYVRFGSPTALAHVARTPQAADIFAAADLSAATALRLQEAKKLLEAWPLLGFGSP